MTIRYINREGKIKKFINQVKEITFNGKDAIARGQEVYYITERAVFKLTSQGLELIEIAEGIDIEDILDNLEFKPIISKNLKLMDKRIFNIEIMNIKQEWLEG